MKKMIFSLAIFGAVLCADNAVAQTNNTTTNTNQQTQWTKSTSSTWQGKNNGTPYWYRTDNQGNLTWSNDNKKWSDVSGDKVWTDYDGKNYRIQGKDLQWSTDGSSWSNVPNRSWRGSDGTWYRFDNNWVLWTGGTGTSAPGSNTK